MPSDKYDKDSFWTLEKLVPKKNTDMTRFSTQNPIVDYNVDTADTTASKENESRTKLNFSLREETADIQPRIYEPKEGLLKKITVKPIPDKYDFHANFVKAAKLYFDYYTHECEFAKFYSYMPQYTQLTREQKNYYFYWRYCIRRGKYIKTDYSYFYLYIYEIINLPELIPPKEGIILLANVWKAYRSSLPNISSNMSAWIQDYCMIYDVRVPMDIIGDFVFSTINASGFFEFYLSGAEMLGDGGVRALLSYLSDYDWRSSRYAGGDSGEVYCKHLIAAMTKFFTLVFSEGKLVSDSDAFSVIERTAFRGALTTSSIKYKITAEYKLLLENTELRKNVTAAVKYTENKLRALLSVKSRLAIKELDGIYKEAIDSYFEDMCSAAARRKIVASKPDYEKLYDAEDEGFSLADADNIEKNSWKITARLVEDSEEATYEQIEKIEDKESHKAEQSNGSVEFGLDVAHVIYIKAVLSENRDAIRDAVVNSECIEDVLCEEINNAFYDNFGDVILEKNDDDEYRIISDYREDVEEWIQKTMN